MEADQRGPESKGVQLHNAKFPNHQQKHYVKLVSIREVKILSQNSSLHSRLWLIGTLPWTPQSAQTAESLCKELQ